MLKNNVDADTRKDVISDTAIQKKLVTLLSIIVFFSVLNSTMFNVSLPDIVQQFHLLPSEASWVFSGFIIFFAISSLTYGKLADTYSVKNLIMIGLLVFNLGSLIGFLSYRYPLLIAARMIQAAGSGAIPALGMLIATRYFPEKTKGRTLGIFASTIAFGGGIGPILGGIITGMFHWRYLFILSFIGLFTIPAFRRYLPDRTGHKEIFDARGAVLIAGTVGSFLLFITLTLWWLLAAGIFLLLCFLLHIRRTDKPFIDPSFFRNRRYRSMIIVTFLSVSTFFGMIFLTPLMLRALNGSGAGGIGLVMFPGAMSAAVTANIGGRIVDKKGSEPVLYAGMTLLTFGFIVLSIFAGMTPRVIALNLVLCYVGFSLMQSSIAYKVSLTLPIDQLGVGMGIYNLFFFMSGAFSASVIGKLLDISKQNSALNPLAIVAHAGSYSNLFLLLAASVLCAALLFYLTFRR